MLDGILGRGFGFKCKSLIKAIRVRLALIRRRAEVKQRILKEDLAKLLASGFDTHAYERTEEFLAGSSISWCYDFIEKSCEYLVKQHSRMDKQGDCPEECRESIASLMFAAARFSDLPELRDLRDICQQRYGSHLEAFVNRTFNEKLSLIPPDPVKRLRVLHDITSEFSIKWDSKGFERKIDAPSVQVPVDIQKINGKRGDGFLDTKNILRRPGEGNHMHRDISADCKTVTGESVKQRQKSSSERGDESFRRNQNVPGSSHTRTGENSEGNKHSYAIANGDLDSDCLKNSSYLSHKKIRDSDHLVYNGYKNGIDRGKGEWAKVSSDGKDDSDSCSAGRRPPATNHNSGNHRRTGDEVDAMKTSPVYPYLPSYVKDKDSITRPPPYTKPTEEDKQKSKTASSHFGPDLNENFDKPSSRDRGVEGKGEILSRRDRQGSEKVLSDHDDKIPLPRPHSSRRKHHKCEEEGAIKRSSGSRRKENTKTGLPMMFDEERHKRDEEEILIDKLLIHHCKKPSNYYVERKKTESTASEVVPMPRRSVSLPPNQADTPALTRVNTFQPDNQARHVHPKLPDYDEIAAQFASLRGR